MKWAAVALAVMTVTAVTGAVMAARAVAEAWVTWAAAPRELRHTFPYR